MNLIAGLSRSLFSVRYYRDVIQASVSKGFLYLALWSFIMAGLVTMVVLLRFFPEGNRFMDWFRQEMPVIELTAEGVKIDKPSPYVMTHPRYGNIITFDMNQKEVSKEAMGNTMAFVSATKLYIHRGSGEETRVYDLVSPEMKDKTPQILDAALVKKFEKMAKPWLLLLLVLGTFLLFFMWKLMAALFYSLIALFINLFREPRLNYEALLNVCFFGMTATLWVNLLELFTGMIRMPFGWLGSLIITTTYLYLGIKFTEDPSPPVYI